MGRLEEYLVLTSSDINLLRGGYESYVMGSVLWFGTDIFTLGVIGFAIRRKKGKNEVRYLGGGVFLACISICFPVMCLSDQAGFAILMSISQSIRMFLVDTGMSDVLEGLQAESLGMLFYPYKVAFACFICWLRYLR